MNISFDLISKLCCAATVCVLVAGCSSAPNDNSSTNTDDKSKRTAQSTPAANANTTKFSNTPQGLKGKLKESYVDFSFQYPKAWQVKETGKSVGAQNYVKVERSLKDTSKGEFTLENFAVGYFSTTTTDAASKATLYPKLVAQLNSQFQKGFPNYKKVSEGKTRVGNLDAYEFRFQSKIDKTPRGPITLWGRAILVPKPDTKKGAAIIMLASNLAPEIKSASDIGVKGQLPQILQSFTFEK